MDEQREALEQLMATLADKNDPGSGLSFTDSRVCRYYLTGLCPHDLFENTKVYTGPCSKIHSPQLQKEYEGNQQQSNAKDYGYEEESLSFLQTYIDDCNKRITRGQNRVGVNEGRDDPENLELGIIQEELEAKMAEVSKLGNDGKIEASMRLLEEVHELTARKDVLIQTNNTINARSGGVAQQKLRVCDICAAFLCSTDSDRRLADHFGGRLHLGYLAIRNKATDLKRIIEEKKERRRENRNAKAVAALANKAEEDNEASPSKGEKEKDKNSKEKDEKEKSREPREREGRDRDRGDRGERDRDRDNRERERDRDRENRDRSKEHHEREKERRRYSHEYSEEEDRYRRDDRYRRSKDKYSHNNYASGDRSRERHSRDRDRRSERDRRKGRSGNNWYDDSRYRR